LKIVSFSSKGEGLKSKEQGSKLKEWKVSIQWLHIFSGLCVGDLFRGPNFLMRGLILSRQCLTLCQFSMYCNSLSVLVTYLDALAILRNMESPACLLIPGLCVSVLLARG
jgi:hypothetical protein